MLKNGGWTKKRGKYFAHFYVIFCIFYAAISPKWVCVCKCTAEKIANIYLSFIIFCLQHFDRMDSQEGEEPPLNGSQTDSRLKSKKPPSLVIAIPPPEDAMSNDHDKQVDLMVSLVLWDWLPVTSSQCLMWRPSQVMLWK